MKYIVLLLLCIPLMSHAQRDFNYDFNTTHAKLSITDSTDSLTTLTWFRHIEKHADLLRIINPESTSDCITYRLHFIGLSWNTWPNFVLVYTTADTQDILYVNPVYGTLSINKHNYYY